MFHTGDKIGSYTLIKSIGSGKYGVVWLAEKIDETTLVPIRCALKLPRQEEIEIERIEKEASLWVAASGHPNVLPIMDASVLDGQVVFASEYAPDGTLRDWLSQYSGKAPTLKAAVDITIGILSGLEHLHSKRIIHRDLKPANILLQGITPRIGDFGLARLLKSTMTSTQVAGTLSYMSPEAFDGKPTILTDIWAAGVILYQLLSGRLPFPQDDYPALMKAILMHEPEPLLADAPLNVAAVVTRALQKEQSARFQSAAEMTLALGGDVKLGDMIEVSDLFQSANEQTTIAHDALQRLQLLIPKEERPRTQSSSKSPTQSHEIFRETLPQGVTLDFVLIPQGSFLMGSPQTEVGRYKDEYPQHRVEITRPFYMSKFPVTQAQWLVLMGKNPSHFKGNRRPVENVTWHHAKLFCKRLSELTGKRYRLPTEAEWEYAARAGSTTAFAFGDKLTLRQANYGEKRKGTTNVGQFRPNAFGLFDMHGNVWEWCEDAWHESYVCAPEDGAAWIFGGNSDYKILRGGAWNSSARRCRSASRDKDNASLRVDDNVGFRIILEIEES